MRRGSGAASGFSRAPAAADLGAWRQLKQTQAAAWTRFSRNPRAAASCLHASRARRACRSAEHLVQKTGRRAQMHVAASSAQQDSSSQLTALRPCVYRAALQRPCALPALPAHSLRCLGACCACVASGPVLCNSTEEPAAPSQATAMRTKEGVRKRCAARAVQGTTRGADARRASLSVPACSAERQNEERRGRREASDSPPPRQRAAPVARKRAAPTAGRTVPPAQRTTRKLESDDDDDGYEVRGAHALLALACRACVLTRAAPPACHGG